MTTVTARAPIEVADALTDFAETVGRMDERLSAQAVRLTAVELGLADLNHLIESREHEE